MSTSKTAICTGGVVNARQLMAAAWLALTLSPAGAQVPELVTDRPDQTESTAVVPPGFVQVEAGLSYTRDREDGVRTEVTEAPGTLVRIGLTPLAELRIGWAGHLSQEVTAGGGRSEESGAQDAEVGAKLRLADAAGWRPEMAVIVATTVPVGSAALSSDRFDPSLRLAFAHELTERVGLGYNVGAAWESTAAADGGRTTLSTFFYTTALGVGLSERVGVFVELFGELGGSAGGRPRHSFDAGVTWLLRPNLQLDLAAGVGLSQTADDAFVGVGLSVRLPR